MNLAAKQLVVLSPHLDDAVLSCGEAMASSPGAIAVTLFAGAPPPGTAMTDWDRAAGFNAGDDVMALRRDEDREALALLGARPVWLDFCDDQYADTPTFAAVAAAIDTVLDKENPDVVLFPAGLFHADHGRAHEAALRVMKRRNSGRWLMYEDALYRRVDGLLSERIASLTMDGYAPERVSIVTHADAAARKRRAIECYRSQLRALGTRRGHEDAFAPEGYWRVAANGATR